MRYGIGVDLGGTNIKIVAVSEEGQVLERSTCETQTDSPLSWVETIRQRIKEIEKTRAEAARWIGLAAPGLAARDSHTLKQGPHSLTRWSASWRNWNGGHKDKACALFRLRWATLPARLALLTTR